MTDREGNYRRFLRERAINVINEIEEMNEGRTPDVDMDTIAHIILHTKAKRVLELGTQNGFSAIVMGDIIAQNHPDASLLTIDISPRPRLMKRFVEQSGLENVVSFRTAESLDPIFFHSVEGIEWDVIYIDTVHSFEYTKREIMVFSAIAKPHTKILLHDASSHAQRLDMTQMGGVKRAIKDFLFEHPEWQGIIIEQPAFPSLFGVGVLYRRVE